MVIKSRTRIVGEVAIAAGLTGLAAYYALNTAYPTPFTTSSPQHRACIEETAVRVTEKLTGQPAEYKPAERPLLSQIGATYVMLSGACALKLHAEKPQPPQ